MIIKFYQRISIFIALCVCFEVYKLTPALLVYCGYLCFRSGTCGAWDVTNNIEITHSFLQNRVNGRISRTRLFLSTTKLACIAFGV